MSPNKSLEQTRLRRDETEGLGNPDVGKGAVVTTNGAKGKVLAMEIISAIIREYEWPNC